MRSMMQPVAEASQTADNRRPPTTKLACVACSAHELAGVGGHKGDHLAIIIFTNSS
eukprot:CAMPEP_0204131090 /NCGR_PEP_ID=MMETSP0361-20130328/13739_1 /ASSEMBLY_ACC=CAM_ASM_000343 /TAXON_ID=268821 /ORGANISM="Scrippsiella Hangoei, Strain SHTV-5" /LENGTH=55 /DNA_ID=CAMNT_0051083777 /DNA_START=22 /DNA_END=189 /DNA_ORIENTATION=+